MYVACYLDAQTPLHGQTLADNARAFARNRVLAKGTPRGYSLGTPQASRSERSEVEHFAFRPSIDGVPLLNHSVRVHVDRLGSVVHFSNQRQLAEPLARAFSIEANEAAALARQVIGHAGNSTAQVEQVYFVQGAVPLPAWRVYLETPVQGAFEVVISAISGDALRVTPLTHDIGSSTGAVFEAPDTAHPLVGPRSVESLSGWPVDEGTCPTDLYPSGAPGECWTDGTATIGANADVCLDLNADNVCDRRALGAGGVFSSLFVDSYDQAGDPVPDRDAAMVNAFYWVNALHDWLYRLGFDEASGNFQGSDAVIVDVQDGAVTNNATFSTPPAGIAPRMQLGLYPWSLRDSAFDGDIIVHEYAHGVTNRLVGGPSDVAALSLWQSGALGEGWSDVLSASFTGDPIVGEYVANNPASGIRTAALDTSPYTFGRLGSLSGAIHGPTGRILPLPEVHADGEIWSAVLWAVREQIGKDDFEQTLIDALKLTPVRPSMIEARDAFIQAAGLLGVGGPDACQVWVAFAARGLGASAALNPTEATQPNDTALSVLESYDKPVNCGGAPPTVLENLLTETAEADNGWQASGLWHRSTRKAAEGAYSWWFGQEPTGDYNTGARVVGDLISPPIDLTGSAAAVLSWDQYFRGEGFNSRIDLGGVWAPYLNADSGRVWVSTDDGNNWLLISHVAHDTPDQDFASFAVNLTRFAGSVIRLRFDFDTFTASNNTNEGWFVDNIRVDRTSTDPVSLAAAPSALAFVSTANATGPPSQNVEL
jgi:Zn-dependent metalloprotease